MKVMVPGATLHWQQLGEGPVVLMLQGGDGDADASNAIAEQLGGYRVVSYDRRGLSRSALHQPGAVELALHTADALAVLDAATPEPAYVFGTSIGALLGLDLVARFPARVKRLVAHEPPATELLGEKERAATDQARDEIDQLYRSRGVLPAMRKFLAGTGVDFLDREPEQLGLPAPNPARMANLKFFLEHDAPAARRFSVDLPRLKAERERLVIAAGERSRGRWNRGCAEALAAELGLSVVDFPGDHGGYVAHPRGFAAKLSALFR